MVFEARLLLYSAKAPIWMVLAWIISVFVAAVQPHGPRPTFSPSKIETLRQPHNKFHHVKYAIDPVSQLVLFARRNLRSAVVAVYA